MIKLLRKKCPNQSALKHNYKYPENKQALLESSHGKCIYCETKIKHSQYGDVEHIKPKSLYQDLTYIWDNLGIACIKCNRENKKDNYHDDFINPFTEDPEKHLTFAGGMIFPKNGSDKGRVTRDILKLNRSELLEKRYTDLIDLQNLIDKYYIEKNPMLKNLLKEQLLIEIEQDKEFSACKKSLLREVGILE